YLPGLGEEVVDTRFGDRRLTTAVLLRAQTPDDVGDGLLQLRIGCQGSRNQAVAVGLARREQRGEIIRVGRGQGAFLTAAQYLQQAARGYSELLPLGTGVKRSQTQRLFPEQTAGDCQAIHRPGDRVEDFGAANPPIAIDIRIGNHALIKLEIYCRASKSSPDYLIQISQRSKNLRRFQLYLIEAASPKELPAMGR